MTNIINQQTTSFLKTESTLDIKKDLNNLSTTQNISHKDKQIEDIVLKYLDLKKKINLLLNKL